VNHNDPTIEPDDVEDFEFGGPTRVMSRQPAVQPSDEALVPLPVGMDWWLLGTIVMLAALGLVMAFSASIYPAVHSHGDESFFLDRHIRYLGLGLLALLFGLHMPYQAWRKLAYPMLAFVIGLLIYVMLFGETRNRATRWILIAGTSFQPAELGKFVFVVYLALSLSKKAATNAIQTFHIGLLPHFLVWALVFGLCMKQPDLGTGLVLAILLFTLTFIAGARIAYLLFFGMSGSVLLLTFLVNDPMRSKRLMAFLEPLAHRSATAYQLFNGKLAVATGGLAGRGLGASRQKLGFIPEAHTDFVLSIIGEELGVIGISLVAFAFAFVLVRGLRIALHARCEFGRLLAMGIVILIGAQTTINFGVVLGLLPTKGLTLPFISYGGSSLLVMSLAVGVLLNVGRGGHEGFRWPDVRRLFGSRPKDVGSAEQAAVSVDGGGAP